MAMFWRATKKGTKRRLEALAAVQAFANKGNAAGSLDEKTGMEYIKACQQLILANHRQYENIHNLPDSYFFSEVPKANEEEVAKQVYARAKMRAK